MFHVKHLYYFLCSRKIFKSTIYNDLCKIPRLILQRIIYYNWNDYLYNVSCETLYKTYCMLE